MKQSTFYYLLRRGVIGGGGSAAGPTNTLAPVISGTAERGETLTSTTGTWTGTGTISYTYQWKRNGADISGATSSTYVLVAADDNAFITCNVTATDDTGSRSKLSNTLGPVLAAPLSLTDPVASGTAQVGQTLSTTDGTWQGIATITFAYQWRRDAVNISGATSSTYTLVAADYSTDVDCVVTATNSLGSASADSNDILNIAGTAPVISGVPTISSQTQVGETITATAASVSGVPTPSTSWQWQRSADGSTGWANISGATSSTYTLVLADDTNYVRAVQTETNALGSDSANSAASGQISQGSAFDADYQAVLDRSTALGYTAPSAAQQTLQNTLVEDLKTAGIWSKLDALYIMANDGSSDFGRLNWASPSTFELSEVNSPTFTSNEGFTGNGSSSTLDTGINMGVDTTQFNQSTLNGSFGGWSYYTKITGGPALMGDDASINNIRGGTSDYIFGTRVGVGTLISGLYHMNADVTDGEQFVNGSQLSSSLLGSLFTSNNTMHLLSEGAVGAYSGDTISIAFIGGDLSAEASDLYNAFNTYMSAI